jgi:hypothetical protein
MSGLRVSGEFAVRPHYQPEFFCCGDTVDYHLDEHYSPVSLRNDDFIKGSYQTGFILCSITDPAGEKIIERTASAFLCASERSNETGTCRVKEQQLLIVTVVCSQP